MKLRQLFMIGAMLVVPFSAVADSWKDESGHRHRYKQEYKHEYWEGYCKVKREYKNGEYKEKRKCKEPDRYTRHRYDDRYYSGGVRIIIDPVIEIGGWRD